MGLQLEFIYENDECLVPCCGFYVNILKRKVVVVFLPQ